MIAGNLRHNIVIQSKQVTGTGDRGQDTITWVNTTTVPAMIEELSGRKLELARQLVATASHKVTIRYLSSLSIKDKVLFGSRTFNIGAILNTMMMNFTQELLCTEEVEGN